MSTTSLTDLTDLWWYCVTDVTALLDQLSEDDWDHPTHLAGWDVRAVASHIAHLEAVLAGRSRETADVPDAPHINGPMGQFTEIGVVNRRDRPGSEITAEIRHATATRRDALAADPPTDPSAPAPGVFGAIGWSTELLFRNRPLDLFMHEQDIRWATGRPGTFQTAAGDHTVAYLGDSTGYVLAKKLSAPAGTSVVLDIGDVRVAAAVGENGRGSIVTDPPDAPTFGIAMDRETYLLAAGGRRQISPDEVTITGDDELGRSFLAAMAVTP